MKKKKSKAKAKPKAKAKKKKAAVKKARVKTKAVKKATAKKSATKKKKAKKKEEAPRTGVIAPPNSVLLGLVEDFFAQINVIALTLEAPLRLGSRIQVLGHTTNLEQVVDSMQIDHQPVVQAGPKDAVGIKVQMRARKGDHVYLLK